MQSAPQVGARTPSRRASRTATTARGAAGSSSSRAGAPSAARCSRWGPRWGTGAGTPGRTGFRAELEPRVGVDERRVAPAGEYEVLVPADLDDVPVVEHHDLVGVANRREAVRDRDR